MTPDDVHRIVGEARAEGRIPGLRWASKDEALADARAAHRMLATAEEHDRGFARRHVTDWEEVSDE